MLRLHVLPAPMHLQSVDQHHELQQRLERVLRRLCPRWLMEELDDLVQAAMLKIHRRGDDVSDLETGFLFRVGHSVMVDEIRRRKRRKEISFDGQHEQTSTSNAIDPETAAAGTELGRAIHSSIQTLNPAYQRAVSLRLHGHSVPEISKILGVPPKKAENQVYRGLAELRKLLKQQGLTP